MNTLISEANHQDIKSGSIFAGLRNWFHKRAEQRANRAAFQHLLALDDNMLNDIGVHRGDVAWANNLPLSQNAALELQKIAATGRSSLY